MKLLITGGCGRCGPALAQLQGEKVIFDRDRRPCRATFEGDRLVQGELGDLAALAAAMEGADAVIHLAAASGVESAWEDVHRDNILGMRNALEAARETGVERFIFASSNHVVGMVEEENKPGIYELDHGVSVTHDAEVRPDSLYGVSKAFGEDLGRFFAEECDLRFYALRIGAMVEEDHPYAHAEAGVRSGKWSRDSQEYQMIVKRLKALWLSKRDFRQLIEKCLAHHGSNFHIFNATSDNARGWLDIAHTRAELGFEPLDHGEDWLAPPGQE